MKRKIASDTPGSEQSPFTPDVGPRFRQEEADRLKAILRTRADDQFELDRLFSGNPKIRHQTRQRLEKLLIQSEAAETMAPGLQRDMSKMAFVTDAEAKILGLEKTAGMARIRRMGLSAAKKKAFLTGTAGPGLDEAGARAGAKFERRMRRYPGGERGYTQAHNLYAPGEVPQTVEAATAQVNKFRPNRAAQVSEKTASIAPNVDAWFEKQAAAALPPALSGRASAIKGAITGKPGAGPTAVASKLGVGSA